jgi:predicted short-subunit dehydrogenase-like oxidoreductase (DUF2520 family)
VGRSLAQALRTSGYNLTALIDRQSARAKSLAQQLSAGRFGSDLGLIGDDTQLLIICVPDDQIGAVDQNLRRILPSLKLLAGAHTSGALEAKILSHLAEANVPVASLHPLQTFVREDNPVSLRGVYFALEGDPAALQIFEKVIANIGAFSVHISSADKALYHSAAVFASNFLPVILHLAAQLAHSCGISQKEYLKMITPLCRQSLEQGLKRGPARALTGPVARGDVESVQRHLHALKAESPAALAIYRMLSLKALELAIENGLDEVAANKVQHLLTEF